LGDLVNLRRARKARTRAEDVRQAAANRALHGQSKAERQRRRLLEEQEAARHAGHRRRPAEPE